MEAKHQSTVRPFLYNQMRVNRGLLACSVMLALLGGCDGDEAIELSAAVEPAQLVEFDWDEVALPQVGAQDIGAAPVPTTNTNGAQLRTFWFHRSDAFAVSMAPGGLFAQTPADIAPLEEPNDTGLFVGVSIRDEQGDVTGYGSEQHDIDYASWVGHDTYTLTFPGRGALMLAHDEDASVILGEVNDMVANAESVRTYEDPLVYVSTLEGSGRVIGGTGEYANAKGTWREVFTLHELNLLTLEHTFDVHIQVALLPNEGSND